MDQEVVVRAFGWEPSPRLAALAARGNPDENLSPEAAALVFAGMNPNTLRTYRTQWWKFVKWCGDTGRSHVPGEVTKETIIEFMNHLWRTPGRYGRPTAPESVALALKVIAVAHRRARRPEVDEAGRSLYGYVSPTTHPDVHRAKAGYIRQWLSAGHRPDTAYPLTPDELTLMILTLDLAAPNGTMDAALLSIGYDLGGRRVELAKLNVGDVAFHVGDVANVTPDDRVEITIAMSKTDQSGEGAEISLYAHNGDDAVTCPVRWALAVMALLPTGASGYPDPGAPFFRVVRTGIRPLDPTRVRGGKVTGERISGNRVALVVARTARDAGLLTGAGKRRHIVPHSLRAGSATSAAEGGADTAALNAHYRWSDRGTTANRYVRAGRRRSLNAARRIWRDRKGRRGEG